MPATHLLHVLADFSYSTYTVRSWEPKYHFSTQTGFPKPESVFEYCNVSKHRIWSFNSFANVSKPYVKNFEIWCFESCAKIWVDKNVMKAAKIFCLQEHLWPKMCSLYRSDVLLIFTNHLMNLCLLQCESYHYRVTECQLFLRFVNITDETRILYNQS